jgi:hypothetical protein
LGSGYGGHKKFVHSKLAEFLHVEIKDLFRDKSTGIVINQQNTDNKDSSINNGIVLLLTDKEAVDQLVEVMKATFEKNRH